MTDKVCIEQSTEVTNAQGYAGQAAVAVRFRHNENSSAILGLTERQALTLAVQLIEAVGGAR